jgi:hypothetical protein
MKRVLVVFLMLICSASAFANTSSSQRDYSRDAILKVLHDRDRELAPFQIDIGMLQLRTRTTQAHFAYLPLLAPLPYTRPIDLATLPNPFVLTGTDIPYVPRR